MRDALADISQKLAEGAYQNEEHVRIGIILRLLQELGWAVWDPKEVNAEFKPVPKEDNTKVDFALFIAADEAPVYIEAKPVGGIGTRELPDVELKVRDYNRDNRATILVITDGREWRFYYSQTGGEFRNKCFKVVNIQNDSSQEVESALVAFLRRESIVSGEAENEAKRLLAQTKIERVMEESLLEAQRRVQQDPYPALPDAIVLVCRERGQEVVRKQAEDYLKRRRTVPPPPPPPPPPPKGVRQFDAETPPDLRFASFLSGDFGGSRTSDWNGLAAEGVKDWVQRGCSLEELNRDCGCAVTRGRRTDKGFHPIPETDLSLRYMDARGAFQCAFNIARRLTSTMHVRFQWQDKKEAAFPNQTGEMHWPKR